MWTRPTPWLAVKVLAVFHALVLLGPAAWLIATALRGPRLFLPSPGGTPNFAGRLTLAAGVVLLVGSLPYVLAVVGVMRERGWGATLLMIAAALQGAAEAVLLIK